MHAWSRRREFSPAPQSARGEVGEVVWSLVIPAYNEERRLPSYLGECIAFFEARGEPYEIIVVDDGSHDRTCERVRELRTAPDQLRLIALRRNRGKGYAVRVGMLNARGAFRLFADADGATPIAELERLVAAFHTGADIAIGSRAVPDPTVIVQARRYRVWAGRVFNRLVARFGVRGIADTQCGFKCFRGTVAEDLFKSLMSDGFAFDVELLLLARRRGYRLAEVAVNWTDQPGSKVRVLTHGPAMLWQVVKARVRLLRAP